MCAGVEERMVSLPSTRRYVEVLKMPSRIIFIVFFAQDKFVDSSDRINALRMATHELHIKMMHQMRVHKSCTFGGDNGIDSKPHYLRWSGGALCVSYQ